VKRGRLAAVAAFALAALALVEPAAAAPGAGTITAPTLAYQKSTVFTVAWSAREASSFDVRYRAAPWNGGFGGFSPLREDTSERSTSFTGAEGSTYCFSARAHGVLSWGPERCTSVPRDDVDLAATSAWSRRTGAGYYLGTYSNATRRGASLTLTNVQATGLALVVTKGPGHGTVGVSWNGSLLKKVSLAARVLRKKQVIPIASFTTARTGTVRIFVSSTARPVRVEGLGVRRLPAPPAVAAAGDIACDPPNNVATPTHCQHKATSDFLVGAGLSAVFPLGDTQYVAGSIAEFTADGTYDDTWGRVKPITRPIPGNHEYITANAAGYFQYFGAAAGDPGKGYYSFDLGDWHVVALNSEKLGAAQNQWLTDDLDAHPTRCTLGLLHVPRFSSVEGRGTESVKSLWQVLYDHGAELVLSGDGHAYERWVPQRPDGSNAANGIRQFVVGTGGKNLYPWESLTPPADVQTRQNKQFGVLRLTLRPTSYSWRFQAVPRSGYSFTDSGSTACH
jgi:hypothetical protein